MEENKEKFLENLKIIGTIPGLLKNNTEQMAKIEAELNDFKKDIGKSSSVIATNYSKLIELKALLSNLNEEELKEITLKLTNTLEPLKKDLKTIILKEILVDIEPQIKEVVLKDLKTLITTEFIESTSNIIKQYEEDFREKIESRSNTIIESIENNTKNIEIMNNNKIKMKEDILNLINALGEDRSIRTDILEKDRNARAREVQSIKDTSSEIIKNTNEYNFLNSSEFHFYNNISQAILGAVLTVAGAIKRYNIILILILLAYTVFKGFIAYKVGTKQDKYNLKAIDEEFFNKVKDKIVLQVLYFLSGIALIICNMIIYDFFNKKININLFNIALITIDFIVKYQILGIFIINLLGFIPFLIFTKIENSFKLTFKEQETYTEDEKRKKEIVSRGFKFIGFLLLGMSIFISIYYFVPTLFLKY
ncbi:hypothetical protein H5V38_11080 (plasmid) [Fusobacterium hwasookii]|uniref:hypothetical protein n=2 Tax=Fusobacterium hwasookii TaxID=1583098 RepID=UPI001625021A|nr:hypothetical protein [Fusobacterium hwasookii]QNE69470.1 hypothetical protein H5V38_11080 [Fusobacterium hwasookii]